ncbi:hypothetical protein ACLBWP_03325 [Microbacterium sp. M1A1_1b]
MPRPVISKSTLDEAAATPVVRAALRAKAKRVLPRAQRLAYAAGAKAFGDSLRIEEGTRPGTKSPSGIKRPFVRVIATSADAAAQEHGDVGVPKQAILRRSAGA